jgi:hypothetical protein
MKNRELRIAWSAAWSIACLPPADYIETAKSFGLTDLQSALS